MTREEFKRFMRTYVKNLMLEAEMAKLSPIGKAAKERTYYGAALEGTNFVISLLDLIWVSHVLIDVIESNLVVEIHLQPPDYEVDINIHDLAQRVENAVNFAIAQQLNIKVHRYLSVVERWATILIGPSPQKEANSFIVFSLKVDILA